MSRQKRKAEKRARRRYRFRIIFGLIMPFMLQALGTTIIASALPVIAADFNQIPQLKWIISSFNLAAASFLPLWAQAADLFGRHATLHAALLTVAVSSAICTAAPTLAFGVLLLGRALQGAGTAALDICVRTVLADRVSLADYAITWTVFAVFSAVGFIAVSVGGWVVGFGVYVGRRDVCVGLGGGGGLADGWGGVDGRVVVYEWAMVPGRAMARVFPAQRAMMPVGAAMFAVVYFIDLYFTLVLGKGPSEAGSSPALLPARVGNWRFYVRVFHQLVATADTSVPS
ncbi:major facilitator superfamily domain-containing protein [Podospora appendiculata]|uniref:Major facilitator superfamily domain-containing protein n=1 Tax=Podospora appendiculata TaxID=314037 RepID=A0AAE0XBR3_9PEZI|nr:major facilitator superfamily domain-containing protein [Podospora appendiculata]